MSPPGKAQIFVRDPRPLRPPARERRIETQALEDITFKCYGEDVTVLDGESAVCPPTAAPTVAPKITNTGTYKSAASEKGGLHCSWRGCKWW